VAPTDPMPVVRYDMKDPHRSLEGILDCHTGPTAA
jgi:hypothetical protein